MKQSLLFFFLIALVGSVNGQKIDTCRPNKFDSNTGIMTQGFPFGPCFTGERDTIKNIPMIKIRYCNEVGASNPPVYFYKYKLIPDTCNFFDAFKLTN